MNIETAGNLIILFAVIVSITYGSYRRLRRTIVIPATSVLLTHYTDTAVMMPLRQGKIGDMHFSAIAAISLGSRRHTPGKGGLLIRVELPFRTKLHLLGIPKKPGNDQVKPTYGSSLMEHVELEGDFDNYFSLYCEKGMQTEVRYVFDPKAMAFTVDFCQSHNWEIINDELYFLQTGGSAPGDSTSMSDDIIQFVKEIRPAVEAKNSPLQDKLRTPYGQDRRTNLKCPICSVTMTNKTTYFSCPNNDGVLAFGSLLAKLRSGKLDIVPRRKSSETVRSTDITCPSCNNQMTRVPYNNGPVIIDTCSRCPYRWLDAGEFSKSLPSASNQ